jgi:hypothetical protein
LTALDNLIHAAEVASKLDKTANSNSIVSTTIEQVTTILFSVIEPLTKSGGKITTSSLNIANKFSTEKVLLLTYNNKLKADPKNIEAHSFHALAVIKFHFLAAIFHFQFHFSFSVIIFQFFPVICIFLYSI